jgi:heavy metal translocating P-type ATPase
MTKGLITRILFVLAAAALALGFGFAGVGNPQVSGLIWSAATAVVLAWLCVVIIASLRRGEFGLDILAALSMAGSLAIGEPLAGNVVALMFSGGNVLESYAEGRASREMTALLSRVPRSAQRYAEDSLETVALEDLAPGDRLLIRPGDVVPVDGGVSVGTALLDESAVTGEALPVEHRVGAAVMSGTTNAGGSFDLLVTHAAAESTYAGIVRLVEAAQRSRAPMARLADRYALYFLGASLALAGGTYWATADATRTLAVLVVATPCPLILAVPVALVAGMSRCAAKGVLVKGAAALEMLARSRTLLLDKTGTLTGGVPGIVEIVVADGHREDELLRLAGSLAQASPHVVSVAIAKAARERGLVLEPPLHVVENHGSGTSGQVGSHVVALGTREHIANGVSEHGPAAIQDTGRLTTHISVDGRPAGAIVMADEVRTEAGESLADLRGQGIERIVLVTGDRAEIAAEVARGLPIDRIEAGATPSGKVDVVVQESRAAPSIMVGDGVNDAPALAAAGVGVAMGARGAAASAEAADMVILVDSLDRLPLAFRIARRTRAIALQSVGAGMGLSILGMIAASLGWLTPVQGALLQEAIDVAVILNALRALRG